MLLLLLQHQLAQRRPLLRLGGEGHPETVLGRSVPQLNVGLSHDAVLLEGEGAGEEGLGDTWGQVSTGGGLDRKWAGPREVSSSLQVGGGSLRGGAEEEGVREAGRRSREPGGRSPQSIPGEDHSARRKSPLLLLLLLHREGSREPGCWDSASCARPQCARVRRRGSSEGVR